MRSELKDELTYKIIGCAMKVQNTLGNGFQEKIYQRCLEIELKKQGIQFDREQEMPIFYEGVSAGTRRADFIVEGTVMVELKAVIRLEDVHLAQGLNYLEAYKIEKGLLINFGSPSMEVKRLFRKHNHARGNSGNPAYLDHSGHPDHRDYLTHPGHPGHPDDPDHPDSDSE